MTAPRSFRPRSAGELVERVRIRSTGLVRSASLARPSRGEVVSDGSTACVSLTTYGKRTDQVSLTIESIARGSVRPARLILWLDPADWRRPPTSLRRLADRGLELREAQAEWGPHKKYYPYCRDFGASGELLVTADDDVFYPKRWLANLVAAADAADGAVVAHRARTIEFAGKEMAPYGSWMPATTTVPSVRNLAIGMGGVGYPPAIQRAMAAAGERFMEVAPRADDLWLHLHEVRAGTPVTQVAAHAADFPVQPGSQQTALALSNQSGDGNDSVVKNLYEEPDLERLRNA